MGVCEPLMLDVVASKAHQSYVSSADLPLDSLRKNLAGGRRTLQNHKLVGGRLLEQYGSPVSLTRLATPCVET